MAAFSKVGIPSLCSVPLPETGRIPTQRAAAAIKAGDFCSLGTGGWSPTTTAGAGRRMAANDALAGEPVTFFGPGCRVRYGAPSGGSTTPGTLLYLSGSVAGGLDTTTAAPALVRALANDKGVFEGVVEILAS